MTASLLNPMTQALLSSSVGWSTCGKTRTRRNASTPIGFGEIASSIFIMSELFKKLFNVELSGEISPLECSLVFVTSHSHQSRVISVQCCPIMLLKEHQDCYHFANPYIVFVFCIVILLNKIVFNYRLFSLIYYNIYIYCSEIIISAYSAKTLVYKHVEQDAAQQKGEFISNKTIHSLLWRFKLTF